MSDMEYRLGDLYEVSNGLSKGGEYFGAGFPFLTFSTVFNNFFIPAQMTSLVQSTPKEQNSYSVKKGDIFITRTSETIEELGMSCVALKDYPHATFNGFCKRLRPITDKVDPRYIGYYFRTPLFRSNFLKVASLITRASLRNEDLLRFKVELPDLASQREIASILSAYDELIENNNKRIKVLEQMAANLYKEWFVRFRFPGYENAEFEDGIPKGWEEMRLGDFGISLDSGSRPSGGINSELTEGVPSLGAEAVNGLAEFDFGSVKYIPCDFYKKMKRGKNTGRDILVYKDGAYIGRTTIFRNDFPFEHYAVNEHVFLLNATRPVYQNYLYFTLHQPAYFTLMQNLNRNAAQPGLSKPDMQRMKIIVPSEPVVVKFNEFVEPILAAVFGLAKQNQNLSKQRDLLLPRLMSGKLEVAQAAEPQPKTTIITFESFVSKLGMAARGTAMSEADLRAMYQAYLDDDATE